MEQELKKKSNIKPIILTIIGLLILLLVALGVFYKMQINNPVNLTTAAIKRLGEGLSENSNFGKLIEFLEDDAIETKMSGNIKLPMEYGTFVFDMLLQEDTEAREAIMDLDLSLNGEAMHLESQLDQNALYFAFKENASKYYFMKDLYFPEIEEIDYDRIVFYYATSFEEVVSKENFKESKNKITVNDENVNAKKYSLEVNQKLSSTIYNKTIDKILNDGEIINAIAKMGNITASEVKTALIDEKVAETYLTEMANEPEFLYNIYVAKNKAVRYEFADVENRNNRIYFDNYKNVEFGLVVDDSYDKINAYLKEQKGEWILKVDSEHLKVNGSISDKNYNVSMKSDYVNLDINGNQDYQFYDDSVNLKEKGNIKISGDGVSLDIPYDFAITFKEIERVNRKNIIDKVDINNMTFEEEEALKNELLQIPLISKFIVTRTPEFEYNYNEEYFYENGIDFSENNAY